jgi:outer membrane protein OmpA-like peptidoglycan-associated protein
MKIFLQLFILISISYGGTYEDSYSVIDTNSSYNTDEKLMDGNFFEIKRFDEIVFDEDDNIDQNSLKLIDDITEQIKYYLDNNDTFTVSIIGNTKEISDTKLKKLNHSNSYGTILSDLFTTSYDENESRDDSLNYANNVAKRLFEKGLDKNSTIIESREDKDRLYLTVGDNKNLLNNVLVAIYVDKKQDIEVLSPVVDDIKEKPAEAVLVKKVVELDSDGDGILDKNDKCPNTLAGLQISADGCHIYKTLRLNFETGSDKIKEDSLNKVLEFAQYLKQYGVYNVQIIGHTDSVGTEINNKILSEKRAKSVKKYLVDHGIESSRIKTKGMGELQPIASNMTRAGKAQNRRIEVIMELKTKKVN